MTIWIPVGLLALAFAAGAVWYANATSVETPPYAVETQDGAIEVRRYPPLVAAEVARGGDRGAAVRAGFGPLARYIFARDRPGEKIAMTAPVTQAPEAAGGWTVAFIMPQGRSLDDLPDAGGDVRLTEWPARRMAAIRFSGRWTDANFATHAAELAAWMETHGLTAAGAPVYAYYNDPFTPFFLRRNEVLVEVAD